MSKLEDKAVEVMDKAVDGMEKLSALLVDVANQYGPDVVDAALTVVQISGAGKLVFAFSLLIPPIIFFLYLKRMWSWATKYTKESDGFSYFPICAGTFIVLIPSAIGVIKIIDPWPWVAVIEPKLWLAHEILKW